MRLALVQLGVHCCLTPAAPLAVVTIAHVAAIESSLGGLCAKVTGVGRGRVVSVASTRPTLSVKVRPEVQAPGDDDNSEAHS